MSLLRVVVVDDSAVARRLLVELLNRDPELEVVAEAGTGRQAVAIAETLDPDVITMDIHMPFMDGYETTRMIMERAPKPIVIVSADYDPNDVARSFKALQAGALTVLPKPRGFSGAEFEAQALELVATVKLMAGVKVFKRRSRNRRAGNGAAPSTSRHAPVIASPAPVARHLGAPARLVAIAASTGGPAALATLLGSIPADFSAPILVVQHLARGFDEGLARWLDGVCPASVDLARDKDELQSGRILIAPHDTHIEVRGRQVALTDAAPLGGHRPSASILFSSVGREFKERAIGVILTGMGDDGVAGLKELKTSGGRVLAQDEASCVVYGMPLAAVRAGVTDEVLPLADIAKVIDRLTRAPILA